MRRIARRVTDWDARSNLAFSRLMNATSQRSMGSLTHVVTVSPIERDKYHMKWCQLRTRLMFVSDGDPYTLKHELHTM
ncbi:hypothetical protein BW685_07230 [Burkholderia ubonensis]|uniref:Uncharacterized protein n=2 Tax=Burkholderia ubonensis TaxID=101571 RepID=A0A1R1JF25_9BURK|nr:hypothetical protein BW685_07230 [Burkholderia ubonensis]